MLLLLRCQWPRRQALAASPPSYHTVVVACSSCQHQTNNLGLNALACLLLHPPRSSPHLTCIQLGSDNTMTPTKAPPHPSAYFVRSQNVLFWPVSTRPRAGWGVRITTQVLPPHFARSPPLGQRQPCFAPFLPLLAPFWLVFWLFFARWGFHIAGTVLPLASLGVRRSPLARAAKNGQFWPVSGPFWPVFGLFLRRAVTVVSGAKCQPSQHPGTPRVAQGWMGLSYSREGAAPWFALRKWSVLDCFCAVLVSLAIFFLLVCPKMPFSVLLHARWFLVVDCLV